MAREFARRFYASKEWEQVRGYVLRRDFYLCRICGHPAEEVHHIEHLTPRNIDDPRVNLNPDNLMSVCRACHFDIHRDDKAKGNAKRKKDDCGGGYHFDENGFLVEDIPPIDE